MGDKLLSMILAALKPQRLIDALLMSALRAIHRLVEHEIVERGGSLLTEDGTEEEGPGAEKK